MKVTPEQAAHIIGRSPQFVRIGIRQGKLPFGVAVKMSSIWTYCIVPEKLADFLGITVQQLEERMNQNE